ncbi:vitamin B12 ABC transporter ATP-binding protein BtuD [Apirhabdus apintestini]|nr:vitamin B12 ABC transporter ATP-binding protein BtuD [Enterobacteriaceae bacterium CA-0114]
MPIILRLRQASYIPRLLSLNGEIHRGECVHLVGPNGAGKSTLLALMAGMLRGSGQLDFAGSPLHVWEPAALARRRAWVTQQHTPPFSMPLWRYLQHHQAIPDDQRLESVAHRFSLQNKWQCHVSALSGGEWQRAGLCAALLQIEAPHEGNLLLLDEPLNNLDIAQQQALAQALSAHRAVGGSVVLCSHDLNYSLHHADRVWLLQQGRCLIQGRAAEVLTPARLESVYKVPFRLLEADGERILLPAPVF